MTSNSVRPGLRVTACLVGLVAAGLVHVWVWGSLAGMEARMDFNQAFFEDFSGPYFEQGRAILNGRKEPVPGFLYTPFFATWMVPLAAAGPQLASWIWLAVLLASCVVLLGMAGPARRCARGAARTDVTPAMCAGFVFAAGLCLPLSHGLYWGQVSSLLTACMLGGLVCLAHGRSALGGGLLGLAAAIKVYPLVLVPILAARRDWRAVTSAVVCFLALALAFPALTLGAGVTVDFYGTVIERIRASSEVWSTSVASQFAGAVAGRNGAGDLPLAGLAWGSRALAIALGALCLTRVFRARRGQAWLRPALAWVCCGPLWLVPAWPHYFAWLPLAWALAWPLHPSRWSGLSRLLVLASAGLASVVAFDLVPDYAAYFGSGATCFASLILVPALLLSAEEG